VVCAVTVEMENSAIQNSVKVLVLSDHLHDQHAEAVTAVQRWGGKTGVLKDGS